MPFFGYWPKPSVTEVNVRVKLHESTVAKFKFYVYILFIFKNTILQKGAYACAPFTWSWCIAFCAVETFSNTVFVWPVLAVSLFIV